MVRGFQDRGQPLLEVPVVERGGHDRVDLSVDSHLHAQIRDPCQDCLKVDLIRVDRQSVSLHAHFKGRGFPGPQEENEEGETEEAVSFHRPYSS